MNNEIAKRLQAYRLNSKLSQEQLAEHIGVSRQTVSKWERAESSPDTENLIALAKLYDTTLDELLFGGGYSAAKPPPMPRKKISVKTKRALLVAAATLAVIAAILLCLPAIVPFSVTPTDIYVQPATGASWDFVEGMREEVRLSNENDPRSPLLFATTRTAPIASDDPADYHTVSIEFDARYLSACPAGLLPEHLSLFALSEDNDALDDVFVSISDVFPVGECLRFFWPRRHVIGMTLCTGGMTGDEIASYMRSLRIEVFAGRRVEKRNRFGSSTESRGAWLPLDLTQAEIHIS